ncbi:MAG: tRNA-dihydrouridine synthase, partial [Pseudomonadota bacterium]
ADFGYQEVNLNVGCPSKHAVEGCFGAHLMQYPEKVGECLLAMKRSNLPVSMKCRIGIKGRESFEYMLRFLDIIYSISGVNKFYIHARIAILGGISPKKNRTIPPLKYDFVYRLKQERPMFKIIINGGITSLDEAQKHLQKVDGVMIGRAGYYDPVMLYGVDELIKGENVLKKDIKDTPNLQDICRKLDEDALCHFGKNQPVWPLARHVLGLYYKQPGAKKFRHFISQFGPQAKAGDFLFTRAWEQAG